MKTLSRRRLIKFAANSVAASAVVSIRRALALPAARVTGTIRDVQYVVILMQENRSFDHYFGSLRGVRGFADRHPVPLASGKPVWYQSDGTRELTPFRLDTQTTSALRTPGTPHTFDNAQAAWAQGQLSAWPKFKTPMSMGHYTRTDIPFQYALAEAFTLCDAHHCSVTTGTDPNRIVFWSGANFDPERSRRGENAVESTAEINNVRCLVTGTLPSPGYGYQGNAFTWPTLPELLERAGITWRIYQDPNDNWNGLMHGCLAFQSFREAPPASALYQKGMTAHALVDFATHAKSGELPQVSWILPSRLTSEHPSGSSALQGAEFTAQVLNALTGNPEVWGRTALILTFDENDGLFDHAPPPAPPSYNLDGTLAGKATLDLAGLYLSDPERKYLHPDDQVSGTTRPWGLGPRVPMYVISPWSRGGWVNSQVFDHTSVGRFLERRFGISVPAISPWHRAICGDLTSCFDFETPNDDPFPELPQVHNAAATVAAAAQRPAPAAPASRELPSQERGVRRSRALPYEIDVRLLKVEPPSSHPHSTLHLEFRNTGRAGAVLHVYDRRHLDRLPRRYTVEAGRALTDAWALDEDGRHDLWICGPNGFVRELRGIRPHATPVDVELRHDPSNVTTALIVTNQRPVRATVVVHANAYHLDGPWQLSVAPNARLVREWSLIGSHGWYDLTVRGERWERRFAGRLETGRDSMSDPAV